jgi:hypothetical protein
VAVHVRYAPDHPTRVPNDTISLERGDEIPTGSSSREMDI